jgi:hypothetical protein
LSAQVIPPEPHPQPPSTGPAPQQAEEVSLAPPSPVPVAAVVEGETTIEAPVSYAALFMLTETDPSGGDAVVIVNEDSMVLPSSGNCDAMILPTLELAQVMAIASRLPATEMPVPYPVVEVQDPPPAVEVVVSSLAPVALTTEEVMELAMCRYINFPSIGVIDLEAPQLPEKVYEVAAKRMCNEPMIMETIASVSKALQKYERTEGFAPTVVADAEDVALTAPTAHVKPTTDASMPPWIDEGQGASPPQPVKAAEAPGPVAEASAAEAVVKGEGTSSPRPVAAEVDGVEILVLDEPATIVQESATPKMMTRAASPQIREAEEIGASL